MPKTAAAPPACSRLADWDDDVFDVAQTNHLRSRDDLPTDLGGRPISARKHAVATADWHSDELVPVKGSTLASRAAPSASTALVMTSDGKDADEEHLKALRVQELVQATWDKANAVQDQAVASAVREALAEAERVYAKHLEERLMEQEKVLMISADEATKRLWNIAHRERDVAVQKALEEQAAEVIGLRKALEDSKREAAEAIEKLKEELTVKANSDMEVQHSANINAAVQAAWDRAGRMEATAVAQARKEATAEAELAAEARLKVERMQLGSEMRKSTAEVKASTEAALAFCPSRLCLFRAETRLSFPCSRLAFSPRHPHQPASSAQAKEQLADEVAADKAELRRLRQELERERSAARDAEAKAAKQQAQAVKDAMAMMEDVAKANTDRAVARALANAAQQQQLKQS